MALKQKYLICALLTGSTLYPKTPCYDTKKAAEKHIRNSVIKERLVVLPILIIPGSNPVEGLKPIVEGEDCKCLPRRKRTHLMRK